MYKSPKAHSPRVIVLRVSFCGSFHLRPEFTLQPQNRIFNIISSTELLTIGGRM